MKRRNFLKLLGMASVAPLVVAEAKTEKQFGVPPLEDIHKALDSLDEYKMVGVTNGEKIYVQTPYFDKLMRGDEN